MLAIEELKAGYGDIEVLRGVSVALSEGDIASIVGPNGAGKTTLMRTLMGLIDATAGRVVVRDEDITTLPSHERISRGLSLVPEERHLFREMSVQENLKLGSYSARDGDRALRYDRVYELFPRLRERKSQKAGTLSGGEAQMLTIGRALMADPDILLLDEPSIGLAPKLIPELFEKIEEINGDGVSVVLVEQRVDLALELADVGYLLEDGQTTISGDAADLLTDERVIEQYLGGA